MLSKGTGARFSKVPATVSSGPESCFYVCRVCIQGENFNNFCDRMKLSVNEAKLRERVASGCFSEGLWSVYGRYIEF